MLRKKNFDKLDGNPNVTVMTGTASFLDGHRVKVRAGESELVLEGAQIFLNTGARPFLPPIPGLTDSRQVYVSETLLDLKRLPRELLIVGGGYIGMEFASIYKKRGMKFVGSTIIYSYLQAIGIIYSHDKEPPIIKII